AVDIQPGDEVITTPITWIATAAAAVVLGATIKFADVDPTTLNIDPNTCEALITPRTKAICPVHLYGLPVDMAPIMEIAQAHGIKVIEDSAHAPGATYNGTRTGNIGDVGCFSFHEQKNMSTLGEGGMVTTNDPDLYVRVRSYKSHCTRVIGKSMKYMTLPDNVAEAALANGEFWFQDFDDCGYNFRMNDVTATVGICQLAKLEGLNERRREVATQFTEGLASIPGILLPKDAEDATHVYHLYPIQLDPAQVNVSRDAFIYTLRADYGIKCGVHYMPLVQTTAFRQRGFTEADAPIACERWPQLVTLPIHPRMTDEAVEYLIDSIKTVLS
ncbi:MAG TPA: DegT/DnrJ/EryC1/StrS family aminotransferase, partial [Candidatus Lokiarchaeia archaeon]|nr:DegT/DnrJ/EryC1/StrS family aminotransferase [Candidatus Lokiarchaeia archaeon]